MSLLGLAPHGASGLKLVRLLLTSMTQASRPARGEWIEIDLTYKSMMSDPSLAPHGASGLKYRKRWF